MENSGSTITEEQVYKMIERVSNHSFVISSLNFGYLIIIFIQVRCETHLSHKLASHAVNVVLENFLTLAPSSAVPVINEVLAKIEAPPEAPPSLIDNTQDMTRLFVITEDLDSVKNDAQQRSWELFDDQGSIIEYVKEFNCILVIIYRMYIYIFFKCANC